MRSYFGTGAGSLTADPALRNVTKSFGGGETFNFNSGNKAGGMFDPVTLGLGLGSSAISGLFGMGQAKTSASIAQAQLKFAERSRQDAFERDKLAGALNIFGQTFGAGTASDLSFGREKEAQRYMLGPLAELGRAGASDQSKRERLARISSESKEAASFENLLNMKRTGFQDAARMEGLFGPTGFSRRFTNI
jgi:hypothetical protein